MLLTDHLHRAAMSECLVDGEIETRVRLLQGRPVQRAAPVRRLRSAARRTHERRTIGAVLHEQELDPTVGSGLQRLLPAGGGAAVSRGLLPPAREQLLLPACTPLLEQRTSRIEEPGRIDVRLGRDPANERRTRLGREQALEAGARLLRTG